MKDLPLEFKKCWNCSSEELASRCAYKKEIEEGKMEPDAPTRLELKTIPKFAPTKVAGVTVPMIVSHYDICADCGVNRCTKVEIKDIPIQMGKLPGQGPGGFPFPGMQNPSQS